MRQVHSLSPEKSPKPVGQSKPTGKSTNEVQGGDLGSHSDIPRTTNKASEMKTKTVNETPKKIYFCDQCYIEFQDPDEFKQHSQWHR